MGFAVFSANYDEVFWQIGWAFLSADMRVSNVIGQVKPKTGAGS